MTTPPRAVLDDVLRTALGRPAEHLARLHGGGLHEAYRVGLRDGPPVVVRVARRPIPWFTDEAPLMAQARAAGVPTPEVLGVEHVEHEGELLSVSILSLVPGRALSELVGELPDSALEQLILDAGELMARVHSVAPGRGLRHLLERPDAARVVRAARAAHELLGAAGAEAVERGAELIRKRVAAGPAPQPMLAHGDFLPKHLMIHDGAIAGVIDWEFAGPAPPAWDLARWEVSAGGGLHRRADLLRRGYARVADPVAAAGGLVPALAVAWALEVLAWENPASVDRRRRCVEAVARHAGVRGL